MEEPDPEIILPEGVYPITDTYDYYTVMVGTGVDPWSGQVAPGLYGSVVESSNDLALPLYFLVDGTVEVKNINGSLYIEVNAINSYDVPVHLVYDGTPIHSAVENVQSQLPKNDCQKRIVNGQLMLIRNGKVYNILGTNVQ